MNELMNSAADRHLLADTGCHAGAAHLTYKRVCGYPLRPGLLLARQPNTFAAARTSRIGAVLTADNNGPLQQFRLPTQSEHQQWCKPPSRFSCYKGARRSPAISPPPNGAVHCIVARPHRFAGVAIVALSWAARHFFLVSDRAIAPGLKGSRGAKPRVDREANLGNDAKA